MILRLAAPAIDLVTDRAVAAAFQIGDDEAAVGALGPGLNAADNPFDAAPTGGAVMELLVAAQLIPAENRVKASLGARFERFDVSPQGGVGATPKMKSVSLARHQSRTAGQQ